MSSEKSPIFEADVLERARDVIAGRSRSYVVDAQCFAKVILELAKKNEASMRDVESGDGK